MEGRLRSMSSVYFEGDGELLCLYRMGSRVIADSYVGAAGGHFEEAELKDAKKCALRELKEELGLSENDIEGLSLRYITLRLAGGEIRQNYYFFARLKGKPRMHSNEGRLEWIKFEDFSQLNMPISAKHMIEHYLACGRFNDLLYAGITQEKGTEFVEMKEFHKI